MSTMTVRSLITELGFDADEKSVQSYERSMRDLRRTIGLVVGAAAAATTAIFGFANAQARTGNEIAKTASELGLAVDTFQELEFSLARISQLSRREVSRAFENINQTISRARSDGGRYADVLARVGFSQQQVASGAISTEDAFNRGAEAIRNAGTRAEATEVALELFGTRVGRRIVGPIRDANVSIDELRQRFRELGGGMDEAATKDAEAFQDAMLDMRVAIDGIRFAVGAQLVPAVKDVISEITDWIIANRELVRQRLHRAVEIIVRAVRAFWTALRQLIRVVNTIAQAFGGWDRVIRLATAALLLMVGSKVINGVRALTLALLGVGGALTMIRRALLRIPLIGLAVLFADDMLSWMQGDESLTGRLVGPFSDALAQINRLMENFKNDQRAFWSEIREIIEGALMFSPLLQGARSLFGDDGESGARRSGRSRGGGAGGGLSLAPIEVTANTTINVPPGTTEQQAQFINQNIRRTFQDEIRRSLYDFSPAE